MDPAALAEEANRYAEMLRMAEQANRRAQMQHMRSSEQYDPAMAPAYVRDRGAFSKAMVGAGAQLNDIYDLLRLASPQEVQQRRDLEKPMFDYGGAAPRLGYLGTNIAASTLPFAGMKAASGIQPMSRMGQVGRYLMDPATVGGSAVLGGIQGAMTDPAGIEGGAWKGALGGGIANLAGKAMIAGGTGLKRLFDPLTDSGQDAILGDYLARSANASPAALAQRAQSAPMLVPGSQPTLAEATGSLGLQRVTNTARTGPESSGFAQRIFERQIDQNKARLDQLFKMAGGSNADERALAVEAAITMRDQASRPLRAAVEASTTPIDTQGTLRTINDMLAGPLRKRKAAADVLGKIKGTFFDDAVITVNGEDVVTKIPVQDANTLYNGVRKNINDYIEGKAQDLAGTKLDETTIRMLIRVRDQLDNDMAVIPEFGQYLTKYRELSRPIDRLLTAEKIINKATTGSEWKGGYPSLRPESYGAQFKDAGVGTVKQATGFARNQGFGGTMTPDQNDMLALIRRDLERADMVSKAGRDIGSPTAELLAGQNVWRGLAGPAERFAQWAQNTGAGRSVANVLGLPAKLTAKTLQDKLEEALLNPQMAAQLLLRAQQAQSGIPAALMRTVPGLLGRLGAGMAVGTP